MSKSPTSTEPSTIWKLIEDSVVKARAAPINFLHIDKQRGQEGINVGSSKALWPGGRVTWWMVQDRKEVT